MASLMEMMQLCRLCLVKNEVNIPIFEEHDDVRQIFLKISVCLPVKVSRDDSLPKKICDDCSYKLEILYNFWNTSVNSEKQLLKWSSQLALEKSEKVAVAPIQPHSINSDGVVLKQEIVDIGDTHNSDEDLMPDDLNVSNDAQDYLMQHQQQLSYQPMGFQFQSDEFQEGEEAAEATGHSETVSDEGAATAPKRKRRAAALKALKHMESDDDEDIDDIEPKIAKTEEQSDDSDVDDPQPTTFVGLPSTSTDNEQPGPSGVHKGTVDTPCNKKRSKKHKPNTLPNLVDRDFQAKSPMAVKDDSIKTPAKTFKCVLCEKEFCKKQSLKYHSARHVQDYKVKCDQCEKGFYTMLDFKRHYAVKHKGLRFVCNHCKKTFVDEYCFKRHIKTHDTNYVESEYKCCECNTVYKTRGGLNVHMKKHKNITYICDICGKSVSSKSSLNHHIMVHTGEKPFVCETCGKCFNKKMLLRIHERIHTKIKPYSCEICNKSFSQRSTLTVHLRYHTGHRPYKCEICQKRFVTKTLLKVHAKVHGTALVDM